MLRSSLIYLSKADWARQIVMNWQIARKVSSRFVAGERLVDAINAVKTLNANGINATLDHLGEHTNSVEAAENATEAIMEMAEAIHASGVRSNISIKLTQIGLGVNEELCEANLRQILKLTRVKGIFVRIDMEDSPWVDHTLNLFIKMQDREKLTNCGVVIQAYLYRSEDDIRKLVQRSGKVRLCKGAYKEPPEVAYPKKTDVDQNYDNLTKLLIEGAKACGEETISEDGRIPPMVAIATHDEARIQAAKKFIEKIGIRKQAVEFQMLYGIRRDLQEKISEEGYPVRVYVPFGTEWYPYFVRRLAERPANLWFFVSNFFKN